MFSYINRLKLIVFIQISSALISIIGIASMPYVVKMLFDYDFSQGIAGTAFIVALYVLSIAVGMIFEYISQSTYWKFKTEFCKLVRQDLFDTLLSQDYVDFKKHDQSEYLSFFQNDIEVFHQYVQSHIAIVQTVLQLLVYGFFLFSLDYRLALVIILSSICSLLVPKLTGQQLTMHKANHLSSMALYTDTLKDLLSGFRFVNNETRKQISERHQSSLYYTEDKEYVFGKSKTLTNVVTGSSMYLLQSIVFGVIAALLYFKEITIGSASAALGYIQDFCYPVSYILKYINNINASKAGNDKILSLLSNKKNICNREVIYSFKDKIEFRDVSVNLGDFSFGPFSYTFEKGKKYAIIGPSGTGKSTIFNLLMQYIQPEQGCIYIDGQNITGKDCSSIMVCVNQFEHLFHASFHENASLFNTYTDEQLEQSLQYFHNSKINSLTEKENAQEMSGGEGQMLQLIRAVTAQKSIILLDEALSAVDAQNSEQLREKLLSLDKTILFITHDISKENLSNFDQVLKLGPLSPSDL